MKRSLAPVRALTRDLVPIVGSFAPKAITGTLPYDAQSGGFTPGLVLTGGTSAATATVVTDTVGTGGAGVLALTDIVGTFVDNEAITDSSTGAAVVNGSATLSTAPTALKGLGWTVARTSAGLYTVTLAAGLGFASLVGIKVFLQLGTADDKLAQVGTLVNAAGTTPVFQILIWDRSAAAPVDLLAAAIGANTRVHFTAWFRSSAGQPTYG